MNNTVYFLLRFAQFFLEWEIYQTYVIEKIKTHILCSITFFPENRVFYEKMKNVLEPDRLHMTIRPMRIACWISKAADTQNT